MGDSVRMMSRASIRNVVAGLLLAGLCWLAFGGALNCGFVRYDDDLYVFENPRVQGGLTWDNLRWAFMTGHAANWHPVTWLSFLAEEELHGLAPAGCHLTNLLLHTLNVLLLFGVLFKMTGRFWPSFWVAALWAVHPLRVESVVWIAERKDVLAMCFGLLALLAYGAEKRPRTWRRQAAVAVCFVLSLMAKPMWVTLPFLLLLLDVWPLGRWPGAGARTLIREKIPLFLLAAGSSVVTYFVQQAGKAMISIDHAPLQFRLANAVAAYAEYVRLMFWPTHLTAFYPHLGGGTIGRVLGSLVALAGVSALAVWTARRRPWLLIGWLWFLGSLVPMIGLVQVGGQAWADRYTYLPHIGLLVALVWGAAEAMARWVGTPFRGVRDFGSAGRDAAPRRPDEKSADGSESRPYPFGAMAVALVIGLALLSRRQTEVWRDTETLFQHALANTKNNAKMHFNLGVLYHLNGRLEESVDNYLKSLAIQPRCNEANFNLANHYRETEQTETANRYYRTVIRDNPQHVLALHNLARMLALDDGTDMLQAEEALALVRRAAASAGKLDEMLQDTLALAYWRLGKLQVAKGRLTEAEGNLKESLVVMPATNRATLTLADLYLETGRKKEAVRLYRIAVAENSRHAGALNNLAWLLAADPTGGREQLAEALELAQRAVASAGNPTAAQLDTLALALAATGDFKAAAETAEKAMELANAKGEDALAKEIGRRLAHYRAGEAWRE